MKIFLALILLTFTTISCSKIVSNAPASFGTITADINGVPTSFDLSAEADTTNNFPFVYFFTLSGMNGNDSDEISIELYDTVQTTYTPGTYSNLYLEYIQKHGKAYSSSDSSSSVLHPIPAVVTFTAVTDSTVQGTFEGTVGNFSSPSFFYTNITNGKFYIRIQ